MPLVTEIIRDGETLKVAWDQFTLNCMLTAACKESIPGVEFAEGRSYCDLEDGQFVDFSWAPIYYMEPTPTVLAKGRQTLKEDHTYGDPDTDYYLELKAGDVLRAWREHKSG